MQCVVTMLLVIAIHIVVKISCCCNLASCAFMRFSRNVHVAVNFYLLLYNMYFILKVFYEEELDVPMVLFDEVLDHVLRIDRIFRQPQGHLLLIGVSGAGKTTLSRFVAWMNGLSVFQVKVHNKYTAVDFDEDLRSVLRRAGCRVSLVIRLYNK